MWVGGGEGDHLLYKQQATLNSRKNKIKKCVSKHFLSMTQLSHLK